MLDRRVPAEAAIAALIVEELGEPGPPPFTLPEPTSTITSTAARLILDDATEAAGTATLARAVGVGVRTLERRACARRPRPLHAGGCGRRQGGGRAGEVARGSDPNPASCLRPLLP